jgi:hypothetical protein
MSLIRIVNYLFLCKGEQATSGESFAIHADGDVMGAVSSGGDINHCELRAECVLCFVSY